MSKTAVKLSDFTLFTTIEVKKPWAMICHRGRSPGSVFVGSRHWCRIGFGDGVHQNLFGIGGFSGFGPAGILILGTGR